jgi:PAS domain S-box-containing protein
MILMQSATVKRPFTIPALHAGPARIGTHRPPSKEARRAGRQEERSQNSAISPDPESPDRIRIRILSVDSHPLFREGIARIISQEPDMVLVSQASTVQEAIQQYREHRPDITLMETRLPDLGGIEGLTAIRAEFPAARIMVLTTCDGDVDLQRALKAGASGYLLRNTSPSELLQEIRKVHLGQKAVQAELAAKLAEHIGEDTLPAREAEVPSQNSKCVIYRDITECKRAEQKLRQSEAYLAEAQRLSQTGSWAWNPATGENTYGSEECLRVLGFDPAGPIPRFEEFFQRIHPDDQAASRERFEKAIRDKADFEFGYRIVHPDKGVRDIHVVGHAVLNRSGDLCEFVGTVIDITERKRAEQELQQLVDFVPQLIVVLDSDGKRIHTNRVFREYTGLTPEELRSGDAVASLIHPHDLERMLAARDRGNAAGEPFELDARLRGKDGIYRWFLARYNPLVEEGRARRWYLTATEIESRKQEEERIRQENVRLEERTRIAQELHDTLLQTFQSASLHLGAAVLHVAQDLPVKNQLDRILEIMRQGIVESRSAIQGLRSPGSQTSDLVGALSRIQDELKVQPDIDFRITVTGRPKQLAPEIQHEIYRIGREALLNAFCHSGAKRIELELEYSGSELCVRIRDNGCGIEPRMLEKGRDGHWGLAGMRERTTRIGGVLKILSSPAAGTEVQLSIPASIASALPLPPHSSG